MSLAIIAFGLILTFAVVVWAALVLWGVMCPSMAEEMEYEPDEAEVFIPPAGSVPRQSGEAQFPVVVIPEAPPIAALRIQDADNVVSLSEWRERNRRAG